MERREFLKRLGILGTLAVLNPTELLANDFDMPVRRRLKKDKSLRLTIIHTNDVHSHIEPFPPTDKQYANLGGYARRKAYIDKVRAEGNDTLVFECGDMFQGTPYFNFYKGKLEIELMNLMGIDAVTIGNHEFDNGLSMLCERIQEAEFPFLNANYQFKNKQALDLVSPYTVFRRAGVRIGVFGLGVKLAGLVSPTNSEGTAYLDPIKMANKVAKVLRKDERCKYVIALSHLGFDMNGIQPDDQQVARETTGIDMILGGHTHTFLPKPVTINNLEGKPVIINQVGFGGINVGRIDLDFSLSQNGKSPVVSTSTVQMS